jgi:hypothetical protein
VKLDLRATTKSHLDRRHGRVAPNSENIFELFRNRWISHYLIAVPHGWSVDHPHKIKGSQMTITTKVSMLSVLSLLIAAPAVAAQLPATEGDYYAPTNTIAQQPTAQQAKQAQEGDYYSPTNGDQVSAQRSASIKKCTQQANAKFGPSGDISWRRFNHDAYAECMTSAGQPE